MSAAVVILRALRQVVAELTPEDRRELGQLAADLGMTPPAQQPCGVTAPAYTTASLAAQLAISERAVRGAIARGDLHAEKRGGRWVIPGAAVEQYAGAARLGGGSGGCVAREARRATRQNQRGPLRQAVANLDRRVG